MDFLLQVNLTCFLMSYLVALVAEVAQVLRVRTRPLEMVVFVAVLAGLVAHTAYLIARFQSSGLPPLVGSSHDWLLVLAWLGVVLSLLLSLTTQSSQAIFLLPVILVLVLMAVAVDDTPSGAAGSSTAQRWTMLHASSLVLGIGLIVAATGAALMYLLQYRKLQGKLAWVRRLRLPSLERLTTVNYWLVLSCFPLLSIGLFTGFVIARRSEDGNSIPWDDPIVWGTIVVWLIMTIRLFLLLQRRDQTGRMVARRTLLAGGFLVLTIFGLTLATGSIHGGTLQEGSPEQQPVEQKGTE